jgi:hypothetical protein
VSLSDGMQFVNHKVMNLYYIFVGGYHVYVVRILVGVQFTQQEFLGNAITFESYSAQMVKVSVGVGSVEMYVLYTYVYLWSAMIELFKLRLSLLYIGIRFVCCHFVEWYL